MRLKLMFLVIELLVMTVCEREGGERIMGRERERGKEGERIKGGREGGRGEGRGGRRERERV